MFTIKGFHMEIIEKKKKENKCNHKVSKLSVTLYRSVSVSFSFPSVHWCFVEQSVSKLPACLVSCRCWKVSFGFVCDGFGLRFLLLFSSLLHHWIFTRGKIRNKQKVVTDAVNFTLIYKCSRIFDGKLFVFAFSLNLMLNGELENLIPVFGCSEFKEIKKYFSNSFSFKIIQKKCFSCCKFCPADIFCTQTTEEKSPEESDSKSSNAGTFEVMRYKTLKHMRNKVLGS